MRVLDTRDTLGQLVLEVLPAIARVQDLRVLFDHGFENSIQVPRLMSLRESSEGWSKARCNISRMILRVVGVAYHTDVASRDTYTGTGSN